MESGFGFDYTRTINRKKTAITLSAAKELFVNRFKFIREINNKMEQYELLRSRSLCRGCSNDTIAKLGCRVQTSVNTEDTPMLNALIMEEEIVELQQRLTNYDDMLRTIIEDSGLTEAQKILMDIIYFTGDKPVTFSEAVPIYKYKAHVQREFSRHYINNELNRIFNNNIIPTLDKMYNG